MRAIGITVHRTDIDHSPAIEITVSDETAHCALNGQIVAPRVVLFRYFSPTATGSPSDSISREFIRNEWRALSEVLRVVFVGKTLNAGATPESIDVLTQLQTAKRCGFDIPTTRITNTLAAVPGSILLKAVSIHSVEPEPGTIYTVSPRMLEHDRAGLSLQLAPVVAQATVDSNTEVRVYVIDTTVVAYRVVQSEISDRWKQPSAVHVTPYPLPQQHHAKFLEMAAACDLDLCAIDAFIEDEKVVFLEVNPVFNWMWYEARANAKTVSALIVKAIAERVLNDRKADQSESPA
ncbi:hypothetical protein ACFWPX_33285 [Nocardia sp. NPDC058518]|uniref:hypothetical protein n=1 Tax=Nocardia sp. NPDC058518 TaxID=3346534 RepID=UPI00364D511F